jgi:hypothetical protein
MATGKWASFQIQNEDLHLKCGMLGENIKNRISGSTVRSGENLRAWKLFYRIHLQSHAWLHH